ncbi:uncharacterized [Tachysurus ichikawai]
MEIFLPSDSLLLTQHTPESDFIFYFPQCLPHPSHHILHPSRPPQNRQHCSAAPSHLTLLSFIFMFHSALLIFKHISQSHADVSVRMKMELFFDFKLSNTLASQIKKKKWSISH